MTRWIKALAIPAGFVVFGLVAFHLHWDEVGVLDMACAVTDMVWPMVAWPRRPHLHLI